MCFVPLEASPVAAANVWTGDSGDPSFASLPMEDDTKMPHSGATASPPGVGAHASGFPPPPPLVDPVVAPPVHELVLTQSSAVFEHATTKIPEIRAKAPIEASFQCMVRISISP